MLILADNYISLGRISELENCSFKADINHQDKSIMIQNDQRKNHIKYTHLSTFPKNNKSTTAFNDKCMIITELHRNGKKLSFEEINSIGINYQVINYIKN